MKLARLPAVGLLLRFNVRCTCVLLVLGNIEYRGGAVGALVEGVLPMLRGTGPLTECSSTSMVWHDGRGVVCLVSLDTSSRLLSGVDCFENSANTIH